MDPRRLRNLVLAALLLAAAAPAAAGQSRGDSTSAGMRGIVVAMPGNRPVPDAVVSLVEARRTVITNALGEYEFLGVAAGSYGIAVKRLGFTPLSARLDLPAGKITEADLELDPIWVHTLERLAVVESRPDFTGFAQRKRTSAGGTFLTAGLFDSVRGKPLHEVLENRVVSAKIVRSGSGGEYWLSTARGVSSLDAASAKGSCYSQIYVDGIRIYAPDTNQPVPDLREFDTRLLEGVEYYPGPATTPPQYGGSAAVCGTLLIWHKTG